MKFWVAAFLGLAILLGGQLARAEPLTRTDQIYRALDAGRYGEVEAFYAKVRRERRRDAEGKFLFEDFYRSVYWYSSLDPNDPSYWPKVDAATRAWVAHSPRSHLAAMTRSFALAYHGEALQAHGGSWAEVDRIAAEAQRLIDGSRAAGASDPLWHATRLRVAAVQGAPRSDVRAMVLEAVAVDPYPLRLWQEAAIALSPDGRDSGDLAWLMRLAVQRTSAHEGSTMYARVLNEVFWHYCDCRDGAIGRTGIDWTALNASFFEWKARYPAGYAIDLHAALACGALDRRVTAGLLAQIGTHPRMDVWNLMGGQAFLDRCRSWATAVPDTPRT